MTILSQDITNHVPFCGPCLFLRDKSQRVREILNLMKGGRGKTEREKEIRRRNWGFAYLLLSFTPRSDVGMCPMRGGKEKGVWWGIRSDQSLNRVRLFATPWIAAHQASLSITNSWSSLRLTSIESVMPSAISSSVVLFSSCPQSLPASVFSNESTLHMRWPKYWSFSFSISPSKEIPGLISFWMDWLDLLAQ